MRNRIKFLGFILLFIFIAVQANGQKCKFDYEKADPITGEETKGNTFAIKIWWKLGFNKIGDQYFVGMRVRIDGNMREIITPENTIDFKLENGEIITINASEECIPIAQATGAGVLSQYDARFNISEDDLQKMASSPLIYVRTSIGTYTFDENFSTKKGKSFQNNARCIIL